MQVKFLSYMITGILIITMFFSNISINKADKLIIPSENYLKNEILDGGFVEKIDGVTVLHINGTYYEMGYQHGYFLKDQIKKSISTYNDFYFRKYGLTYDRAISIWNKTKRYIPKSIIDELNGLADGSGLSFDKVVIAQTIRLIYHCSIVSASGPATTDGKLYFARSLDWSEVIKDYSTGEYLNNHVLFLRSPDDGYTSMYPGYSGFIASYGGINEMGISIGVTGSWSNDETYFGLSERFKMKKVLDKASNAEEAINIITQNKTTGVNVIISDSKTNESYIIEQTANITYIGKWNSKVESNNPCWEIKNVLRRTNFFINKTTAKTQRYFFDPRDPLNLFSLIRPIHDYNFYCNLQPIYYMHYNAISIAIEKNYGLLNLFNTMQMIRGVYRGEDNLFFKLNNIFWKNSQKGYYSSHQWVACPETGEMLICFSQSEKRSFECPIHYFNLFDLKN